MIFSKVKNKKENEILKRKHAKQVQIFIVGFNRHKLNTVKVLLQFLNAYSVSVQILSWTGDKWFMDHQQTTVLVALF